MNDHCVLDMKAQVLRCEACGTETPLSLPAPVTEVVRRADQFIAQHRRCRPLHMTTAGTWYPPAALQPSTYDPSAGTGGFLANPPFRPMADLTARSLRARRLCGDRVVLDWLEAARLATPTRPGGRAVGVTTRQLMELWACCQSTVSRRIAAINSAPPEAGLGRIVRDFGRGSQGRWLVVSPLPSHPQP